MITDIETDPRHGLQVRRYHTWRTHQVQSTGEHSAQVMRVMLTLWPECPRNMIVHALFHDVGEMAGDLPWPVKKNDPVLKERMDHAETKVHLQMSSAWGVPRPVQLTEWEANFFKMCESLEMWEFSLTERNMGNRYATIMATRMLLQASTRLGILEQYQPTSAHFGTVCKQIVAATKRYVELRKEQEDEIQYVQKENVEGQKENTDG